MPQRTTERQMRVSKTGHTNFDRQRSTGGNRRLAQWRVTWLIEHSTSHQLLWCIDSFELRNPPLRQAPNISPRILKLMGSIELPENFEYNSALKDSLSKKYKL
jgi:hypothetical protein